jgi:hypothetical protein
LLAEQVAALLREQDASAILASCIVQADAI